MEINLTEKEFELLISALGSLRLAEFLPKDKFEDSITLENKLNSYRKAAERIRLKYAPSKL